MKYLLRICLLIFAFCHGTLLSAQKEERLNVLFLGVDDLRTELNSYGCKHMVTPNIDRLAEMGLQFNRAYVQQAVCAASRASFLTGCRPNTTTVNYPYNDFFTEQFVETHPTIPVTFAQNGYYTRTLGKIHHGYKDKGLTEDHFYPGKLPIPGRPDLTNSQWFVWRDTVPPWAHPDLPDSDFEDGNITDETIATIRRASRSGKPFFIAPGFKKPHLPFVCPKKYYDLYDHDSIRLSPNPELDPSQDSITAVEWGAVDWNNFRETGIDENAARELKHHYQACVSFIDAQVGRILDELERLDLMDNTLIMFWSDHGYHLGDHGLWCKHTNYERATRVPLIVYFPGMTTGGKQTQAFVEYVDMYPTLLDLCGLKIPDWIEGLSMVPVLSDPGIEWKKAAFSQYPRNGGKIEGYSVRTTNFRYTEWIDNWSKGEVFHRELYDHRVDSIESRNLAGHEEYADILSEHQTLLQEGWEHALPPFHSLNTGPDVECDTGEEILDWRIYPDHYSRELKLKANPGLVGERCIISLYNLQGRLVKAESMAVTRDFNKVLVSGIVPGIYLVKVILGNRVSSVIISWS
jgi:arylsulfatase A-like enzyme